MISNSLLTRRLSGMLGAPQRTPRWRRILALAAAALFGSLSPGAAAPATAGGPDLGRASARVHELRAGRVGSAIGGGGMHTHPNLAHSQAAKGLEGESHAPTPVGGTAAFGRLARELDRRIPEPLAPLSQPETPSRPHDAEHARVADAANPRAETLPASGPEETATFWAWDFGHSTYYPVTAKLRHVSPVSWIYVEEGHEVSGPDIADLAVTFEDTIVPRLTAAFGPDPDPGIDGVRAVTLLLMDIRDPYFYGSAPLISGYFLPVNQYRQADLDAQMAGHRSNEREMLYIDIAPTRPGSAVVKQTVAHEFQHLIHWNHDKDEDAWLNEGLSELAVHVAGLGHPRGHVEAFLERPDRSLVRWVGDPADYGRGYLFFLYLHQRLGGDPGWIAPLVAAPENGIAALESQPAIEDLSMWFADFASALHLDLPDSRLGFDHLDLGSGGPPSPDRFPAAATDSAGEVPYRISDLPMEPWTIWAATVPAPRRGLDIVASADPGACVAAGSRRVASYLADCARTGPGEWLAETRIEGSTQLILANASSGPSRASVEAVPPAWELGGATLALLPLALNRR